MPRLDEGQQWGAKGKHPPSRVDTAQQPWGSVATMCYGTSASLMPARTNGTTSTVVYTWHGDTCADSSNSVDTQLLCGEQLETEEGYHASLEPPRACSPPPFLVIRPMGEQAGDREVLRNEMVREHATAPHRGYVSRHRGLTERHRTQAVVWFMQQAEEQEIRHETLFLALSYLDRFLSVTTDQCPKNLKLLRTTCLALACKQEEISHSRAFDWARASASSYGLDHVHMERIVLSALDWRTRTPSPWTFLFHFCYGRRTCPPFTISMAAYLLELGMLEPAALAVPYSSLAAAALLLSSTYQGPDTQVHQYAVIYAHELAHMAPGLDLAALQTACLLLARLHRLAAALPPSFAKYDEAVAEQAELQEVAGESLCACQVLGLARARGKYSNAMWQNAGEWEARGMEDLAKYLQYLM
mmetsp:Transcript_11839/g.21071  ORF Transcript_11839/g.21071 Transcript_11839/m.21071 type:complete len:414 (+) Transcript_11839:57-1298(+)|eukprot:CAMPEP_0119115952 /NCGR_PEP_ID=MMETSP1180-20130426/52022_1 /TAXON_ID=3052 ORGANISM="Chlamydomonas cf sp, Strain CCMP681" /NCGR_SAMPLE_ID=MMETSP1180 /ASSEMBLY_ACC=CAM_ASM_000741 /LENGTH=413 /DNA_ID=CAMNT_0007105061 /DNA_START=696 /DNA_END=1937 /DNA_ORIENTATION=-